MNNFPDILMEFIVTASRIGKKRTYIRKCGPVSAADAKLLEQINNRGSMRMAEVTNMMMTTKGASTQMIDKLIGRGYAKRKVSNKDRRVVSVEITEKGKSVINEYGKCRAELMKFLLDEIDPAKRQNPAELITKLSAGIRKYLTKLSGGFYD